MIQASETESCRIPGFIGVVRLLCESRELTIKSAANAGSVNANFNTMFSRIPPLGIIAMRSASL
jgi:hypothetical protein